MLLYGQHVRESDHQRYFLLMPRTGQTLTVELTPSEVPAHYSASRAAAWESVGGRVLLYEKVDLTRHDRPLMALVWDYVSGELHPLRLDIAGAFERRGAEYRPHLAAP